MKRNRYKSVSYIIMGMLLFTSLIVFTNTAKAASSYEVESNDDTANATVIKANKEYYGKLSDTNSLSGQSGETDYFMVKIDKKGYFNINFGPKLEATEKIGWGWNISLYNGSVCFYTATNVKTAIKTPNFNLKKGTNVYIKITPFNYFDEYCPTDVDYALKVNMIESANREIENNDKKSSATALTLNKNYWGSLMDKNVSPDISGETDYYKAELVDTGYFTISFNPIIMENQKIGSGWRVEVYSDDTMIYEADKIEGEFTSPKFAFKDKTMIYVKILPSNNFNDYCPTDIEYLIKVNFTKNKFWEIESNDTKKTANTLKVNTKYYGNLMDKEENADNSGEIDFYKVKLTDEGYFNINIAPAMQADETALGSGWKIEILAGSTKLYEAEGIITSFITPNFSFNKNQVIYIKITPTDRFKGNCPTNIDYLLQVNFIKSKYWEKENNDDISSANSIQLNKKYYGNLIDKDADSAYSVEYDYYTTKLESAGYFNISMAPVSDEIDIAGKGWLIEIYNGKELLYSNHGISFTTGNISLSKGATIHIKITAYNTINTLSPTNVDYWFKVNFTKSDYWEKENNDTKSKATALSLTKIYCGNILDKKKDKYESGENDYYKFDVSAKGKRDIYFGYKNDEDVEKLGDGWNVEVIVNGKTIYKGNGIKDKYQKLTTISVKKGDKVYIKISAANSEYEKCPTYIDYKISVKK